MILISLFEEIAGSNIWEVTAIFQLVNIVPCFKNFKKENTNLVPIHISIMAFCLYKIYRHAEHLDMTLNYYSYGLT